MEVVQGQNTKRGYFATRKCEKPSISSKCMFLLGLRAGGLWRCTPMSHTHLSNAAKVGDLISKVKIDSTSKSWHTRRVYCAGTTHARRLSCRPTAKCCACDF